MSEWIKVKDDMPPHSGYHDSSSTRVLVYVKKEYYPQIYFASYDLSEDGGSWSVEGLSHRMYGAVKHWSTDWEVTHWQPTPEEPK